MYGRLGVGEEWCQPGEGVAQLRLDDGMRVIVEHQREVVGMCRVVRLRSGVETERALHRHPVQVLVRWQLGNQSCRL